MRYNVIVMVSIGDRPWADDSVATWGRYCARHGLELIVERAPPLPAHLPLPDLPDTPGRPNKAAYVAKQFYAWKHLGERERVAVVDDTTCVRATAPNLFDVVPLGSCGYVKTGGRAVEKSFAAIQRFTTERGEPSLPERPLAYMNSGVMAYDRSLREAMAPGKIVHAAPLLFASHPHQTLVYYLLQRARAPMHRLDRAWNATPGTNTLTREECDALEDARPYFDTAHIHHVTSAYRHRARLIAQLSASCLAEPLYPEIA